MISKALEKRLTKLNNDDLIIEGEAHEVKEIANES